jgi:hypothetical protein
MILLFGTGCSLWTPSQNDGDRDLIIKPEDFCIFLFESSEEIYRANIKDPGMWEALRDLAAADEEYAAHYNWLYSTYNSWDEHRRAQLREIMTEYHHHPMSEQLIRNGRQEAGLDEVIAFIREARFFGKMRNALVDFYSWYGSNYALPHYQQIRPLLERKALAINALVEKDFDIAGFLEKETGITLKEKPEAIELLLNMRIYGASGFYRDKVSLTTIQWNATPEKIWATPFHEMSHPFFRTFTGSMSFKYLAGKLKKDEKLLKMFSSTCLAPLLRLYLMLKNKDTKDWNFGLHRIARVRKGASFFQLLFHSYPAFCFLLSSTLIFFISVFKTKVQSLRVENHRFPYLSPGRRLPRPLRIRSTSHPV